MKNNAKYIFWKEKNIFQKLFLWINRHFNFKMGALAGICTGSIVFMINIKYGFMIAFFAFGKQFFYNFFMASYNTKICEKLSKNISNRILAPILWTLIPTSLAFVIIYSVHYFLNTPNPLASTLWQAFSNLFIFFFTGLIFREGLEKKYKWLQIFLVSNKRFRYFFDKFGKNK